MTNPNQQCVRCGKALVKKSGKYGVFFGCSGFPACRYTKSLDDYHRDEQSKRLNKKAEVFREFRNQEISDNSWVNASSIGEVEFCAQSFYLRQTGAKQSLRAVRRMEQGSIEHARVSSDRRCYIASYVFDEGHPVVESLRLWRDQVLMKTWYGKSFTFFYYKLSPILIQTLGRFRLFNKLSKAFVIKLAKWIGAV